MTEKQFNSMYETAKELMKKSSDPVHDWSHCERVMENVFKIKKALPQDTQEKLDDKMLKLGAAWHDISFAFYSPGLIQLLREGKRAEKITRRYGLKFNLTIEDTEFLASIVRNHVGNSFGRLNKSKSLYHQIVQDADTLESFASPARIKIVKKMAQKSLWYRLIYNFLIPLFYNFYNHHKAIIYNMPEVIQQL